MVIRKKLTITNDPDQLENVTDFVSRMIAPCHFEEMEAYRVVLAVNEAVTNIIEHGYESGEEGPIEIEVHVEHTFLSVTIRDEGKEYNPEQRPDIDVREVLQAKKYRGFGTFMMRQIMDELQYRRVEEKNEFTMRKNREGDKKNEQPSV